jgi:hypothetical protein
LALRTRAAFGERLRRDSKDSMKTSTTLVVLVANFSGWGRPNPTDPKFCLPRTQLAQSILVRGDPSTVRIPQTWVGREPFGSLGKRRSTLLSSLANDPRRNTSNVEGEPESMTVLGAIDCGECELFAADGGRLSRPEIGSSAALSCRAAIGNSELEQSCRHRTDRIADGVESRRTPSPSRFARLP